MISHGIAAETVCDQASRLLSHGPSSQRPHLERRSSCRYRTVYRLVKLIHDQGASLCHLRNISDEGMMLSVDEPLEIGERLTVELAEGRRVDGHVVWADEGHCGVALDQPIDSAALLCAMAEEQRSGGYRAPRLAANLSGVAYSERGLHPVRTIDLSQKGMGLHHDGRFQPGLRLLIMLENGVERRGVVRWSQGPKAGVLLIEPLACTDLNQCISCGRPSYGDGGACSESPA